MSASNWSDGDLASAERLADMLPKMHDWTPDWTTTSGANIPSYGNASIDCRYSKSGDLVVAHFDIIFGSTTNFGGGGAGDNWQFSLPIAGIETTQAIGEFYLYTTTSGAKVIARARMLDASNVIIELANNRLDSVAASNTGLVDRITPFPAPPAASPWGNGSSVKGVVEYEAA